MGVSLSLQKVGGKGCTHGQLRGNMIGWPQLIGMTLTGMPI